LSIRLIRFYFAALGFHNRAHALRAQFIQLSNVENATVGATYISQVPEPDSFAMLLAGLGLLGFMAKRKKVDRKPI
jgi:hypothetical protein